MIFLGRCSYMSPLPIELDFITKKEKPAPYRQTSPSIPKPRKSSVILNNLIEIAVDHAVRLVALTVEGFLVHVLIHIRCTPAAHLHGIFLWNVQHCRGAGEDMPQVVKTDLFQTVCLQQFLEPLTDSVRCERNNMIGSRLMGHLLYQCINVCRQIDIAHTLDSFAVVDLRPAAVHLDDLPAYIEPHLHRVNVTELQTCHFSNA